jgi:CspA family cold shock protein
MEDGVVRAIKTEKGYGFLRADGRDLFFHMSGCKTDFFELKPGDNVSFEIGESQKGPRAVNVEKKTSTW